MPEINIKDYIPLDTKIISDLEALGMNCPKNGENYLIKASTADLIDGAVPSPHYAGHMMNRHEDIIFRTKGTAEVIQVNENTRIYEAPISDKKAILQIQTY